MVATIAQASTTGSQVGSSNLQRFKAHHSSTFRGRGDPMVADHWFHQVGKIMEAMEITSDATKIKLARIPARRRIPSVVGLGQTLVGLGGNDMGRVL